MPSAAAALDSSSPASWLTPPSSAYAALGGATDTPPPDTTKKPKDDDKSAKPDTSPQVKVDFAQPGSGMSSEGALEAIGRLEQERLNTPPPRLPQKPQRQDLSSQIQDAQTWGAIAIAFGALASLRTRQPLTTALNSAAAALTASQQRQQDVYDRATQQWQQDTKFAMENFNYEQRAYEDLMDNIKNREGITLDTWGKMDQESETKFRMMTETLKDPVMADAYARYGADGAVALYKQREEQAKKFEEITKANYKNVAMNKELQILFDSDGFKKADSDGKMEQIAKVVATTNPTKSVLTDEQVDMFAHRTIRLQDPYPTGRGNSRYSPADAVRVMTRIDELDPEHKYSASDYTTKQQLQTDLAKGPASQRIQAMGTLSGHIDTLEELQKNLPDMDFKTAQQAFVSIAKQWDPSVTSYDAAKTAVADEFNKVLIGTGAGTGEDRNRWLEIFDIKTKDQMAKNIAVAKELVRSRVQSELRRATNPKYGLKPDDILTPEQQEYWGIGRGGATKAKAEGPAAPAPSEGAQPASLRAGGRGASKQDAIPLSEAKSKEEAQKIWDDAPSGAWLYDGKTYRQKP